MIWIVGFNPVYERKLIHVPRNFRKQLGDIPFRFTVLFEFKGASNK